MSTYVISDIHGCFTEFEEMLNKIKFNNTDVLYILGDLCDRGKENAKVLDYVVNHHNIHLIMGNHDVWLAKYIDYIFSLKKKEEYTGIFDDWDYDTWTLYNGGKYTVNELKRSDIHLLIQIKKMFQNPTYYTKTIVNNKSFILIHAGLDAHYSFYPINSYEELKNVSNKELTWSHIGLDDNPFKDSYMIVGHYPTFIYDKKYEGQIIHGANDTLYHIDCGCVFGRTLGCLRLDDLEEFYVKSTHKKID